MTGAAPALRAEIEREFPRLIAMSENEAEAQVGPGKWTPKQIVGHLIDSASNNHGRFVRGALYDEFVFPGYDQDNWVAAQNYNNVSWAALVDLWRSYNIQIAHLIEQIPQDRLSLPRMPHNLHQIGWKLVPEDQPASLGYLIEDYVGHMKHHLSQIP